MQWVDTAPAALRHAVTIDLRSGDAVVVLDGVGTCVGADEGAQPFLGFTPNLLGRPRLDSAWRWYGVDGSVLPDGASPIARVLATGEPVVDRILGLEGLQDQGDRRFAWVEVSAYPIRGEDGSVEGVTTTLRDVSQSPEGRAATAALVRSVRLLAHASAEDEARFRVLAEDSADVLFRTDIVGRCVWVSPSVTDVLGWNPHEIVGESLVALLHPGDRRAAGVRRPASLAGDGVGHERLELRYATADGGWRWMSALSRPVRDVAGRVTGGLTALRDIQDEVESREALRHLVGHDSLTGLVDRDAARHELTRALRRAQRSGRWVGVLHLDVDRLRDVNDTHGHDVGDRLLVEVARRLTARLRDSDVVARHGGDEFVVILTSMRDGEHAMQRAQALLDAVAAPLEDGVPGGTVSIGVRYDDGSSDPATVLRDAAAALDRAKNAGCNRVSA
jgi:diguanylate cyclase (GGDEF)-like protein/PAS domain S-box-containing protein